MRKSNIKATTMSDEKPDMKTPAIIDNNFMAKGSTYAMLQFPHSEEILDDDPEEEKEYCIGMNLISSGDAESGREHLERSFKMGYLRAGDTLSFGYSAGWFGPRDYHKAVAILRKLVRKGHPSSMNNYAFAYEYGAGVKQNYRLAEFWYKKGANLGNKDAKANLGIFYLFGRKASRNQPEGVRLSFEAADLGQEMAMNSLGICYEKGIVVTRNLDKAYEWYKKAYDNGCGPTSELGLARCYEKGLGVEPDPEKADYFRQQAKLHGYDKDV